MTPTETINTTAVEIAYHDAVWVGTIGRESTRAESV